MRNLVLILLLVFHAFSINAQNNSIVYKNAVETSKKQKEANAVFSDAITVLNPDVYYNPSVSFSGATDGAEASTPVDLSGNNVTASLQGTVVWNVVGSRVQWQFNGSSWIDVADVASLDKTIGTDNFTLIAREGAVAPTTSGYIVGKAEASPSNREYGIYYNNATNMGLYLGGSVANTSITAANDKLHIVIFTGVSYSYYIDGVLENSGTLSSSNQGAGSQSVNIGGRTDGSYLANSGSMIDMVAIVPSAITGAQRTAIESEFQIN